MNIEIVILSADTPNNLLYWCSQSGNGFRDEAKQKENK